MNGGAPRLSAPIRPRTVAVGRRGLR